jgi:hypothetical protein
MDIGDHGKMGTSLAVYENRGVDAEIPASIPGVLNFEGHLPSPEYLILDTERTRRAPSVKGPETSLVFDVRSALLDQLLVHIFYLVVFGTDIDETLEGLDDAA